MYCIIIIPSSHRNQLIPLDLVSYTNVNVCMPIQRPHQSSYCVIDISNFLHESYRIVLIISNLPEFPKL